jgi:hypothetical protein
MKKLLIGAFAAAFSVYSLMNVSTAPQIKSMNFQKISAMTLGYDKSMSEKTIKAAVIDSYFRNICQNGKIIRWNKNSMPLTVYIQDTKDLPEYYLDVVKSAYKAWERASEGLVRFDFAEGPE